MDKEELLKLLRTQFGAYLQKNDAAFERSMRILESLDISEENDALYNFLHLLIIDLYSRINSLEDKIDQK